jgi:5-methylcytosine-specific restriction endonuclease McrA
MIPATSASAKARDSIRWEELRTQAHERSGGRCEFCGRPLGFSQYFELHHRWYPQVDTLNNLMAIHQTCHRVIHFGGKLNAEKGSLAALGDTGRSNTEAWQRYLQNAQ